MDKNIETIPSSILQMKIDDYRVKIDDAISAELKQHEKSIFFVPLKRALEGGKRLRPILLVLSFENISNHDGDPFSAAVAVELAHLESLIHDDIIDMDLARREKLSFHTLYGYEMALLSADFVLSIILETTARYKDFRIPKTLALATASMCEGELEELRAYKNRQALNLDEYVGVISKKTASLFEASAAIGAMIGGATEEETRALSNYGRLLGIAYQIHDDIADLNKTTTINILNLVETNSEKIANLQKIANLHILEAKKSLRKLGISESSLLFELADYATSASIKRI